MGLDLGGNATDEKIPVEDRDNLLMISKDDEIINITKNNIIQKKFLIW